MDKACNFFRSQSLKILPYFCLLQFKTHMNTSSVAEIVSAQDSDLKKIGSKILNNTRLSDEDGLLLFQKGSLPFVGALANYVRERKHGDTTYFNRNFHIEPTNVCVFSCHFCSYSRLYAHREEGWELSTDQMLDIVKKYDGKPETEVHIVGGVHPKMNLTFLQICCGK
jgi:aminodeoxyfutalosine synthase